MNNNYLEKLYKQYQESIGINTNNYDFNNKEFIKWLEKLKKNTLTYKNFLLDNGIMIDSIFTCEIGKSPVDTITSVNTQIQSSYMNPTNFNSADILMYLTHNAYKREDIDILLEKCRGEVGVCYGVYGNINDKDKNKKINDTHLLYAKIFEITDVNMAFSKIDNLYVTTVYTKKRLKYK